MAEYGVGTWAANGTPNNYGIKPVSVVGRIQLTAGQNSGSYSFTIPAGTKVGFAVALSEGAQQEVGRRITASGNSITISAASTVGVGNYPASKCELVVFLENA